MNSVKPAVYFFSVFLLIFLLFLFLYTPIAEAGIIVCSTECPPGERYVGCKPSGKTTCPDGQYCDVWPNCGGVGWGKCLNPQPDPYGITQCEADPAPDRYLSTLVSPAGSGTINPTSRSYPHGASVTITKTPASGYEFTGWGGSCSGTGSCNVSMTSDRSVTANFKSTIPPKTITGTLAASPTSGTTQTTFIYTPSRTGGTATGTITYSNPQCGTGGTRTGWTASTGRFTCTYSSTGTKTGSVTIAQGGVSATPTRSVTVSSPTLSVSLARTPTSGLANNQTTFTFTPSLGGTATGTATYSNPQCGTGGTRTSWNATTGVFACTYSSAGTKTASVNASRGGVNASGSTTVSVGATSVTAVLNVDPSSGTTQTSFKFTPEVTGGTATGVITYSSPECGTGGTRTSWNASTGIFNCTYSAGSQTASVTVSRGGATVTPTRTVTVSTPTVSGTLEATPNKGDAYDKYEVRVKKVEGSAIGTPFYSSPSCQDGTVSNFDSNSGAFRCSNYRSDGVKEASVTISKGGVSGVLSTNVTIATLKPEVDFRANPTSIDYNTKARLEWSATKADRCTGTGFITGNTVFGSALSTNSLTTRTVFSIRCSGVGGYTDAMAEVQVYAQKPSISLTADPAWVKRDGSATIRWNISDATSCSLSRNGAVVESNPSRPNGTYVAENINEVTVFEMFCTNSGPDLLDSTTRERIPVNVLPIYGEF